MPSGTRIEGGRSSLIGFAIAMLLVLGGAFFLLQKAIRIQEQAAVTVVEPQDYGNGVYGFLASSTEVYGHSLSAFIAKHPELDCRSGGNVGPWYVFLICYDRAANAQDETVP